jgi:hypothetical protein
MIAWRSLYYYYHDTILLEPPPKLSLLLLIMTKLKAAEIGRDVADGKPGRGFPPPLSLLLCSRVLALEPLPRFSKCHRLF